MDDSNLYCEWLNCEVPRNKWFCMPSLDNGKKTCSKCKWSREIKVQKGE